MKNSLAIFFMLLFIQTGQSFAQSGDAALKQLLVGKQSLTEIMNTVKTYYSDPATVKRLGANAVNRYIKHWARYEWYMSSRLGSNGEFVNIPMKMMEATGIQKRSNSVNTNNQNLIESTAGAWTALGPFNTDNGIGRVDRLAFHPSDANTVYAGTTAGGLWRTTDAGANWTNLSPDIPSGGISGILIDPVNTNIIYILTGDGDSDISGLVDDYGYMRLSIGVLKSTNGGSTWAKAGDFTGADYTSLVGYRLVMNPTNNNVLYACTNQGIFASLNAGDTWGLVSNPDRFFNMKFKPGSSNICYATSSNANFTTSYFYRSTTGGLTWDTVNSVTPQINNPTRRVELAVAPSNSSRVYLLAGGVPGNGPANPNTNRFKGMYISNNDGLSFSLKSTTPNILGRSQTGVDTVDQSNYDLTMAVSNTNSANVITGAIQAWYSTDTGATWNYRGGLHDDIHFLGYHPIGQKLWAATDGGVYSSTDHGVNWTSHFEDMNITQFYRMALNPDDYLKMIAGAQDNAVKRRAGATSYFDEIACCDGFAVGYDAANSDIMYVVANATIRRSTNGGDNFTTITQPVVPTVTLPLSMSMAVHTSAANSLFVGAASFWRTSDGGANWTANGTVQAGWFLRTCPSNGNRIYAAGGTSYQANTGSLRRSDDGGVTWTNANILSNHSQFPVSIPRITSINVDPTNSLRLWITFGGFTDNLKVYYADYNINPNGLWVNMSGSLPNVPVNCITLDNNNNAYIGTDNGVYYRGTGMNDWVPFYNNLPYVPVTELILSESQNRIRASTFGRGIWSSDLYSSCPTDLTVSGTIPGQKFYEVSNNITSTASLVSSAGSKVQMRGGNEVKLQDGFTARENTQFRAVIGPCGSGGVAGFRIPQNDSSVSLAPQQYLPPEGGKKSLLHIISSSNNQVQFEINQKQNGVTDIILTDETGKIIRTKNFAASSKGKWNNTINSAGLDAGMYYLYVLLDKRVEHMQELMIYKEEK